MVQKNSDKTCTDEGLYDRKLKLFSDMYSTTTLTYLDIN